MPSPASKNVKAAKRDKLENGGAKNASGLQPERKRDVKSDKEKAIAAVQAKGEARNLPVTASSDALQPAPPAEGKENAGIPGSEKAAPGQKTQSVPGGNAVDKMPAATPETSRESDAISAEEFKKLDEKYLKKPGILSRIFRKNEAASPEAQPPDVSPVKKQASRGANDALLELTRKIDDFSFRIDKQDGRFEAESGFREAMNERLSSFAEEIGEIRSMILDREKSFNDIQVGFERINDIAREIQPEKIRSEFEKTEKAIIDNTIKVEKVELFVNSLKEELKNYRLQMGKIKSFDNLLEAIQKIKDDLGQISESKNYVDRKAARVESMFSDLNERLSGFNKAEATIEKLDALTQELMKSTDKIEIKIEEAALKEDLNKKVDPLAASIAGTSKKVDELASSVSKILSNAEKFNVEDIESIKKQIVGIEHILDSLEKRFSEDALSGKMDKKLAEQQESITENAKKISELSESVSKSREESVNFRDDLKKEMNDEISDNVNQFKSSLLKVESDIRALKSMPVASKSRGLQSQPKGGPLHDSRATKRYDAGDIHDMDVMDKNAQNISPPEQEDVTLRTAGVDAIGQRSMFAAGSYPGTPYAPSGDTQISAAGDVPEHEENAGPIQLSDAEREIRMQLVLAKSSISEYNFEAAKKNYENIYSLLSPLLRASPTENVKMLAEISKELYLVLFVPGNSPDKFKQMISDFKAGCLHVARA